MEERILKAGELEEFQIKYGRLLVWGVLVQSCGSWDCFQLRILIETRFVGLYLYISNPSPNSHIVAA